MGSNSKIGIIVVVAVVVITLAGIYHYYDSHLEPELIIDELVDAQPEDVNGAIIDAIPTTVNSQITDSVSHVEEISIQLLFIQTSNSGTITSDGNNYFMTLNDIAAKTAYFSDRPYRIVDHFTTQFFVDNWDEGADSFAMDPPNAAFVLLDDESESIVVVELSNPVYDLEMNTLQYSIKILDDSILPETFDRVVLYIDAFPTQVNDSRFTDLPMNSVIGGPMDAFTNIKTPGVYMDYYEKVLRSQIPN